MSGSCGRFGALNARFLGRCGALDYRVFGRFGAVGARCFGRFGWMLVFGLFFGALHGCQTHDKRMAFMGHSLRAHAVLMLTHAFGALDLKQMALTSGSCGTHVDSCAQLARHSTGRRRHSGVELTCAMQDQSPPTQPRPRSGISLLPSSRRAEISFFFSDFGLGSFAEGSCCTGGSAT